MKSLSSDTAAGHYEIEKNAYANIDVYETKQIENCRFEAHKKHIDIQLLLSGCEELDYTRIDGLDVSEDYDEARDIMFFANTSDCDKVILKPEKFAFIFPHEAHKPQIASGGISQKVKKVVVKILA